MLILDGFSRCVCIDPTCGVVFYAPEHIEQQAVRIGEKRTVTCPNGHGYHYQQSEADKLKDKVTRLEREVAAAIDARTANARLAEHQRRVAIYWKGIATRRKR